MKNVLTGLFLLILATACSEEEPQTITPVPFNQVTLTDGFWKNRMQTEINVTVPFSVEQSAPAVERFRRCAAFLAGDSTALPETHRFISSDLYKVMEGVSYSLMIQPNKELEEFMDRVADLITASQKDDGYLYISHICGNPDPREMGEKPYSWVVHSHELYNVGHLYEAAVAYYQATGKDKLLNVAIKSAKHVNKVFFEGGDPNYNGGKPINQAPGHEEIELALCKLYRVTNDPLYLDMAKKFLEIRGVTYRPEGEGVMAPTYAQQHAPVKEQTEAVGHAVRAAYLYTAMAQVDALTGLNDYTKALNSIWTNLVTTRMHITGGLGAVEGMEGFGAPYELPNLTAYNETCAAVANVFFNYGMYLDSGDAKFLDIAELSLFNNSLAGINLHGDRFFYVNPLEADGVRRFNHGNGGHAKWFGCACCPPNISRLILQVPGYMYAYSKDRVYLTLYGGSQTTIPLEGTRVKLEQTSAYPFDGKVRLTVQPEKGSKFSVCMRIPTWARSDEFVPGGLYPYKQPKQAEVELSVNGQKTDFKMEKGFAVIKRDWKPGDVVELNIPMPVRFVDCIPEVSENIGKTAVTRGPLVYCAEEVDNAGPVQRLYLGDTNEAQAKVANISSGVLQGLERITLPGMEKKVGGITSREITMIPYYAWCNRGDNRTMLVWLNEEASTASIGQQTMAYLRNVKGVNASSVAGGKNISVRALCDGKVSESSADKLTEQWVSEGSGKQWVQVDFREPFLLNSLSVYWLDDQDKITVPSGWSVEYKSDAGWTPLELYVTDSYQMGTDRFNVVHPSGSLEVESVRILIEPQKGKSIGVSEIRFE